MIQLADHARITITHDSHQFVFDSLSAYMRLAKLVQHDELAAVLALQKHLGRTVSLSVQPLDHAGQPNGTPFQSQPVLRSIAPVIVDRHTREERPGWLDANADGYLKVYVGID